MALASILLTNRVSRLGWGLLFCFLTPVWVGALPEDSLERAPMIVQYRSQGRCRLAMRFPSYEPSAVIFPVSSRYSGAELRHVSRELLERLERQTAPRLIPPGSCIKTQPSASIASAPFAVRGQAEGRTGDRSRVANWLTTLGFSSQAVALRLAAEEFRSKELLTIFGWGQTVVVDCPSDPLPSLLWMGKTSQPNQLLWVAMDDQPNWRSERVPILQAPAALSLPACVRSQPVRLYRWLLEPLRRRAAESLVVEYAGDAEQCERCGPGEMLRANDWEELFLQKVRTSPPRYLFRALWRTPQPGTFRALSLAADPTPLQFQMHYPLVGPADCDRAAKSSNSPEEERRAWKSLETSTGYSEGALHNGLCS